MMTTIDVNLLAMVTGGKGQPGATQPQQQPDAQASAQPATGGGNIMDFLSQIQSWLGAIGQGSQHLQQIFAGVQGLIGDFQPLFAQMQPQQSSTGSAQQSADA
jgi:hypothetical protein